MDVKMPSETVYSIIDQAVDMGYSKRVYLNWYNEPLLDSRLLGFLQYARKKGLTTGLDTNADLLTPKSEELAMQLNDALNWIRVTRYDCDQTKTKWLKNIFKEKVRWTDHHLITHFSSSKALKPLIAWAKTRLCSNTNRIIIDYKGEMNLCCEDLASNFHLGNICESSLKELWYSPKHVQIVRALAINGGRLKYRYCSICPSGGTVHMNWLRKGGIPTSKFDPSPYPVTRSVSIVGR